LTIIKRETCALYYLPVIISFHFIKPETCALYYLPVIISFDFY